ncbi:MAG: hypothetical protein PHH91_11610 [Desulfuromonadaceae bacterium]|nr:hypothetical protein [Desulfuromonadaceae bacterium]
MKFYWDNVPDELKTRTQWVGWKYVPNPKNPDKPKKKPIDAKNGKSADVSDPDTWSTFKTAKTFLKTGKVAGIGFVFTKDDPYVGIDLDNCCDKKTGNLEQWADEILEKISSYTEISPSGTGVHIIVKGKLPGKGKRVGNIEIYDQVRYFTVTGDIL